LLSRHLASKRRADTTNMVSRGVNESVMAPRQQQPPFQIFD
jgi:hypothetical protein